MKLKRQQAKLRQKGRESAKGFETSLETPPYILLWLNGRALASHARDSRFESWWGYYKGGSTHSLYVPGAVLSEAPCTGENTQISLFSVTASRLVANEKSESSSLSAGRAAKSRYLHVSAACTSQ